MTTNDNQEKTKDGEQQPPEDITLPVENKEINTIGEEEKTEAASNENNKQSEKPYNIIINIPKDENGESIKQAKRANGYTLIGIIINSLLFLVTLGALWITAKSVKISKESVDLTREALDSSNAKNRADKILAEKQMRENQIQFEANRRTDSIIISRDSSLAAFNIMATKEQNRAFITLDSIRVFHKAIGKPLILFCYFSNVGKTSAYNLVSIVRGFANISNTPPINVHKKYIDSASANTKGVTLGAGHNGSTRIIFHTLTKEFDSLIINNRIKFFLVGKISYSDIYNKKHAKEFLCQFSFSEGWYQYVTDNNKEY